MNSAKKKPPFPTLPLYGALGLVVFAVFIVGVSKFSERDPTVREKAEPRQTRDLQFVDLPDGAIEIKDAATGSAIDVVPPGQNGFMRVTMRSLARQRRLQNIGSEPPFRLTAWSDGTVSLEDPSTGKRVNLRAFGEDNARSIAYLMSANGATK